MCRLFGIISREQIGLSDWMFHCPHPFADLSTIHCHGWGIAWYDDDSVHLEKEPVPAHESRRFAELAGKQGNEKVQSQIILCHFRKATTGAHTLPNTHPFASGLWAFGHNGTIDGLHFRERLNQNHLAQVAGESDSEVYFHWLLQNLEQGGVNGLATAITEVRKREYTALNFLLTDGHTLYAYWDQSPGAKKPNDPDYYQLYTSARADTGCVVVCSVPLDDGHWGRLPQRMIVSVSRQLRVDFLPV